MYKRQKSDQSLISELPMDVLGHILDFCKPERYIPIGLVNKSFNSSFKKDEKTTSSISMFENESLFTNYASDDVEYPKNIVEILALNGKYSSIQMAINYGFEWDHFCVEGAASNGKKELFTWLKDTDLFWLPENAHASAASDGNLEMMKFLVDSEIGYPDVRSEKIALYNNRNDIIEWMDTLKSNPRYVMVEAIRNSDLTSVKRLFHSGVKLHSRSVTDTCINGNIDLLRFLIESVEIIPVKRDIDAAIHMYRYNIVEYLDENCYI